MLSLVQQRTIQLCLAGVFNELVDGSTDPASVDAAFAAIMDVSARSLRRGVSEWNASVERTTRLPDEVLAGCFEALALADRVHASHVSRRWRSVALAFPAVWARIELSADNAGVVPLLKLALARAGAHPLDVTYAPTKSRSLGKHAAAVAEALAAHMHHVRSLDWPGGLDASFFSAPAPMLERLVCGRGGHVQQQFLGGVSGMLHTIELGTALSINAEIGAPPALETVKHARIALAGAMDPDSLLVACPRLETLEMTGVVQRQILPNSTIPPTLRSLRLAVTALKGSINALNTAKTWEMHRIPHVELVGMVSGEILRDMPIVSVENGRVLSTNPTAGTTRILASPSFYEYPEIRPHFLRGVVEGMDGRSTLSISHSALRQLAEARATLPKCLRTLVLTTGADLDAPNGHAYADLFSPTSELEHITCNFSHRHDTVDTFSASVQAFTKSTGRVVPELLLCNLPVPHDPSLLCRMASWCDRIVVESS